MKITVNGSPKELAELLNLLGSTENEAKKAEFPPLLTKLAEDENINGLAEAIRNADKENAPQVETAEQGFVPFLVKDCPNRGHRKRIKRSELERELKSATDDNEQELTHARLG